MGKEASTPAVPDYTAAAQATSAGNLAQAQYATAANRPNQYSPYGSSTWTQGAPTRTFNEQRYNEAVAAAQRAAANSGGGSMGANWNSEQGGQSWTPGSLPIEAQTPDRNAEQFYDTTPSTNWTQNISLTPQAQQTLDKQMALSNRYADLASTGLDKAYSTLEDPTLDMSGIPDRAINQGQTAQDAIMARLNPQFTQQEDALRTRLANQGIGMGSEAASNDFRQFNQKRNDAEMQAGLFGIGLDNANRASALQEQAYLQDRPLNLINALRTGAQVQNPSFGSFAQQTPVSGPDLMGAQNASFQGALGNANAENAASNANTQGAVSAAAMAAMMFF